MSLITEASLRAQLKIEPKAVIKIKKGDIITPSARQFINEKRLKVCELGASNNKLDDKSRPVKENFYKEFKAIDKSFQPKYVSYYDGGYYETKPEHMTHIRGNKLVYKDDKHIVFRGRLDSLESLILEIQLNIANKQLIEELDEVLTLVRRTLRAEVINEPIEVELLFGLNDVELREHSHHPKKHYGIAHFLPDYSMGNEIVLLNKLRSAIREVEIVAMYTFRNGHKVTRADIIQVLNRLSSAVYILMCRVKSDHYLQGGVQNE